MPPLRSRREQWLLALLVLRHDKDTSRDWLASTLWPDNTDEQALFYLRKGLSNLRKALGLEAARLLSPTPRTVRLNLSGAIVDVVEFDRAEPSDAVEIYGGPLLPDCPEEWAIAERGQREQAYFHALETLATAADPATSVRWLRLLVSADPYRESAYRSLMQSLADCGDRAAMTVVYRELHSKLSHDLNASPSPEAEALYKQLLSQEAMVALPKAEAKDTGRHLPVPLSDLIGRKETIEEVLLWLGQRRLVTLFGAGGIGKTRLSIAVAEAALPQFADGVWFVDLAALTDPALVPQATARALGIPEEVQRPVIDSLAAALASRSMLVVLDNCEHLPDACADLAFRLLSSAPSLTILATSRQALNVVGEQVFRVPSLAVPAAGAKADDFEAVKLFVDRASRVDSGFHLTPRNTPDVVEICRELDGIPLAIEMAAARLRSLSVAEVRTRLSDRFKLLKSGNRAALPRQQTLRAAIDWSYDQLSDPERDLLRCMSVFAGGWTLAAAEAVFETDDAEDVLSSLVDKSLAIAEPQGEGTRYRLLETVKQYAHYRLAESESMTGARTRHRDYFIEFALEVRPKLMGADQAHWFSVLDAEHDNLRQALGFCLEANEGQAGLRLAGGLSRFWLTRGHFSEGRSMFAAIAALPSAQERTRDRAVALNGAGLLAWRQSDYKSAEALYAETISISRELGDRVEVGRALNNLALITRDQGDYESAQAMHEESIDIFRESGDKLIAAVCLSNLGVVYQYRGNFAAARSTFEEGLAVQRELGDRSSTSVTLSSLGAVALDQGDAEYARQCHVEGLEIAKELEDRYDIASHLYGLGCAADQLGEIAEAGRLIRESLVMMSELGEKTVITDYFSALASVARKEGRESEAVQFLAARAKLRDATGSPLPHYSFEKMERDRRAAAVSRCGEFRRGMGEGECDVDGASHCACARIVGEERDQASAAPNGFALGAELPRRESVKTRNFSLQKLNTPANDVRSSPEPEALIEASIRS